MRYEYTLLAASGYLINTVKAVSYSVPASPPSGASPSIIPAPVGVSIEFFAFPAYMNNVSSTKQCLQNLRDVTGTWPPMRIGGTTQDRATYNASQPDAVEYTVNNPGDAPASLTFGPSFMKLAGTYQGSITIGFNRRLNNQPNTIDAAREAVADIPTLRGIELGNEPNFYSSSDPINTGGGSWSASKDFQSQVSWQSSISSALNKLNIFSAGVYFGAGSFNNKDLVSQEGSSGVNTVTQFSSHNYPQSSPNFDLSKLMSHSNIASQVSQYKSERSAAASVGKSYVMGETNSATQGGGGISPTFGAALWIVDYVMQLMLFGVESINFHQGTIGNCQYCWWGRYSMGAPYYGAYLVTEALSGATTIAALDNASTNYAGYAIYTGTTLKKILLINSDYYTSGTRSSQTFSLTGLSNGATVSGERLTAQAATSRQDQGQSPSLGGQYFANGSCVKSGTAVRETKTVSTGGSVSYTLQASEAMLVYL